MSKRNVLITTTSGIDGHRIDRYGGIVSARVVTGTGFFSDWAASFSDVFGGRSNAYNSQLKSIYDEVIEQLVQEAENTGANVILGLKIDHDEISGKGKQMFMVTATGTAARIENFHFESEVSLPEVTLERFEAELAKLRVVHQVSRSADGSAVHANWEFIVQNRVSEVREQVFQYGLQDALFYNEIARYFASIDAKDAAEFLSAKLTQPGAAALAVRLIRDARLIDYAVILELLQSSPFETRKAALQLLTGRKRTYALSDIELLDRILEAVEPADQAFPRRGRLEVDKWECECGRTNKAGQDYCKSCDRDIRGFAKDETNPALAADYAKETRFVLRHLFKLAKS